MRAAAVRPPTAAAADMLACSARAAALVGLQWWPQCLCASCTTSDSPSLPLLCTLAPVQDSFEVVKDPSTCLEPLVFLGFGEFIPLQVETVKPFPLQERLLKAFNRLAIFDELLDPGHSGAAPA